ncbi:MAG: type I restriction-modification system subunit M [Deltaproteobacteria bacterium]|nr:type I restriction-modification system subunit M [Deltaproteobacteria bacterium]
MTINSPLKLTVLHLNRETRGNRVYRMNRAFASQTAKRRQRIEKQKKVAITGELKNRIDKIWDDMFSYGMANPLVVIEQLTYLFFMRSLDLNEERNEANDELIGGAPGERIFEQDEIGQSLRWSKFKDLPAEQIFERIRDRVFPFIQGADTAIALADGSKHIIKGLKMGQKSAYAQHMSNANFALPNPLITEKVVTAIDALTQALKDNDLKGDLYEHMIGKVQTAGRIGQFRTPRHIISMMVRMIDPQITDTIADPACGTGGFLTAAGEYVRKNFGRDLRLDKKARNHFQSEMFTGYDTDQTMLRIAAMNTILHNMDEANISFQDSLSKDNPDKEKFSVILANPPFKGSLDHEAIAPSLLSVTKTKNTELLFVALFLRMLQVGGRCACIVPDGVLFGSSNAHKSIRKELIENNRLQAVISMPSGVFRPYARVSTAILVFTKTGKGGTDNVWFYGMQSDGFSLDDKRTDLGTGGDIEDIVARFKNLEAEAARERAEKSFLVPKEQIVKNGYDLSINRYKKAIIKRVEYPPAKEIMATLYGIEERIAAGLKELEAMLNED